jgi:hypothetical protein
MKRKRSTSPAVRIPDLGKFKIKFFSNDAEEPPHVHVLRENRVAKFWLFPVVERARRSHGKPMKPQEAREAARLVQEHRDLLLEEWHAFFSRRRI